ncbi:helix-turn-helix transcriptional regulator [Brevibacterium sp. UCMA 11754]|uniref:helix-turn-helix transcriptional regulator n=1 Tax=Brevibacterium sp. UCMA 11754 TaxID=2749198 RepID=UPI001F4315F5|nr:helix-turn-helix domain-containing protein [Brevibacterium sp. UCMA 11754]MCF2573143.1 helix-turn-helix domain-containing protein [Brevibacterium sp. UCMA 11754]
MSSRVNGGSQEPPASPAAHLTARQLAEREGVPLQTVYIWNTNGTGPRRMKIGKHVRYRLADVLEWEEQQLDPRPAA